MAYDSLIDNATGGDMEVIKNTEISAKIIAEMNIGKTIQQALDAVLGDGAYMKLAGEVYDAMRAAYDQCTA